MREFRATWDDGAVYATKNLERMRAFFRFCEQARWIDRNPAVSVKAPKHESAPALPFSADEMKRILPQGSGFTGRHLPRWKDRLGEAGRPRPLASRLPLTSSFPELSRRALPAGRLAALDASP